MATVASPPTAPPAQRVVIRGISWATYESLLADHLDRSVPHFAYDRGVLEIVCPSTPHEKDNRTLAMLVEVVAEELGIDTLNVGSMTFKREDLQRGFEPDSSFYVANEERVRERVQIDLAVDPPPDLVVEIEVSHPSLDKLPIYAAIGVPEVWRVADGRVAVLRLGAAGYAAADESGALPPLTAAALTGFLSESRVLPRTTWLRSLRDWVRQAAGTEGAPT
jgi:Uma2 family endonuclease